MEWRIKKYTFIELAKLTEKDIEHIKKKLTIEIKNIVGQKVLSSEKIQLYQIFNNCMVVPRFYPIIHNLPYKSGFIKPAVIDHNISVNLISENQKTVSAFLENLYKKSNGCNLIMPTGQGKTYMGIKLIELLKVKTLIVTPNLEIANTWVNILSQLGAQVGELNGNKNNKQNITVGLIHSLIKQSKSWFDFSLIIYDEITEFVSTKRKIIFELTSAPFLLGLTATPNIYKKNIFIYNVGPLIYAEDLPGYKITNTEWKVSVKAIKYYGKPEFTEKKISKIGYTSACEMDKQFMLDTDRNALIVNEIIDLYKSGKNIYVFVSICEAGEIINNLLKAQNITANIDFLMGSKKTDSVINLCNSVNNNIIITTYKFCSKGISIPKMDAIILCQPRKSDTEQTIGRILRLGGDTKAERFIIDIIDMKTTLKNQYSHRKKFYLEKGFKISVIKIQS